MMRTRRPRRIDERVMEVLLDVIHDLVDILRGTSAYSRRRAAVSMIAPSCPGPMVASTSATEAAIVQHLGQITPLFEYPRTGII